MAPAPALGGDNTDGNDRNHNVVVKSESVCTYNCQDGTLQASEPAVGGSVTRLESSGDNVAGNFELVKDEQGECTEYSSSFGNSCSQPDGETRLDLSGMEVDSPFVAPTDGDPAGLDGSPRLLRKRKVTEQWRKTVRPLMWRCQWLELRMKDILSQVSKYDRELAVIKHEKDLQLEVIKADASVSESAQLGCSLGKSSMKRRKRKRHEDIVDTSLSLKKHKMFSYFYEKQNKGAETDGLSVDDDCNGQVEDMKGSLDSDGLLESKESNRVLEQLTLKEILLRIDSIRSRILGLQDRLNKASCKQEKLASSLDHTEVMVSQKSQKTQRRASSCKEDGSSSLQKKNDENNLLQKRKDGDRPLVAVRPALSNRAIDLMEDAKRNSVDKGGDKTQPDMKQSTVKLLFGADNPLSKGTGDFSKENTDGVLMDNQTAREGCQQFEKVEHPVENPSELVKKVAKTPPSKVENIGELVAKQEPVLEAPLVVKHVYSARKQGQKRKIHEGPTAALKDHSEKFHKTPAKKQRTETAPSKLSIEKAVLVTVNSRRSQRVRKPKVY